MQHCLAKHYQPRSRYSPALDVPREIGTCTTSRQDCALPKRTHLVVALLSISLIALEFTWTRLFSAEFFYTFSFLILSLAILGLGLGALALRMVPALDRPGSLGALLTLTGLTALIAPPLTFLVELDLSQLFVDGTTVLKFLLTILLLNMSFFFGGITLALLFRRDHQDMPRLYMADMVGAGVGVILVIALMNTGGAPVATVLCAAPVLVAALIVCSGRTKIFPLILLGSMVWLSLSAEDRLRIERKEMAPVIQTHWDAVAKIKIHEFSPEYRNINIDNLANTPVVGFHGDWTAPDAQEMEFNYDVTWLLRQMDDCCFLSLGSGGGHDVMQALYAGATEVHAVEVIPYINELMCEGGDLYEFTDKLYGDERVIPVTEDARAYIRRFKGKFDFIFSVSSNTWAALASGSFALAENYLFTVEAFEDYWQALSPRGFLMFEHQFYMPRIVSEALEALEAQGVANPKDHIAVYNLAARRRNILLISKQPFTEEIRARALGEITPEIEDDFHLLYPPTEGREDNLIQRIVENGWRSEAATARIDISPCTDDRPYTAQLGLLRNLKLEPLRKGMAPTMEISGFPLAKLMTLMILAVVALLVVPLNLLPYLGKGKKLKAAPWLFFFAIGAAFMMVEVILIQKYTLFIGPSSYSVATILLTLLIASGVGSRFSRSIADHWAFIGIVAWLLLEVFAFTQLTASLGGMQQTARILVSVALLAPLGFFMGLPFPKAAMRVGDLIDWGFAVNGAASVLGSTGAILIAFTFGFKASLLFGALLYVCAWRLFAKTGNWSGAESE